MIDNKFVTVMARYNQWQNESLYQASGKLGEDARMQNRGAFFESIHKTLCHVLWGDMLWTSRFAQLEEPRVLSIEQSSTMIKSWEEMKGARVDLDMKIVDWADGLEEGVISGELTWFSSAANREFTRPLGEILVHFFNHQTHHRGQANAMVSAAGGKVDDTDLFIMSIR